MKKITQADGTTHDEERSEGEGGAKEFNESVDVEQGKSGDKKQSIHHMITHKAPNGLPGMTKITAAPKPLPLLLPPLPPLHLADDTHTTTTVSSSSLLLTSLFSRPAPYSPRS